MKQTLSGWRRDVGLTQAGLSEKTGKKPDTRINQQRISLLELGVRPLQVEIKKLARAGVPVAEIWPKAAANALAA